MNPNNTSLNPFQGYTPAPSQTPKSNPQPQPKAKELTPVHIIILLSIFAAIVLIIITLVQVFHQNPYGEQIKINNLNQYYKNFPSNVEDSIYNTLYNIVANNNPDTKLPKSGAKIRGGTTTGQYNKATNVYTDRFIVDLEELQQSYSFQVTWSPDSNNSNLADIGYPVLATCPTADQLIYQPFDCKDGFSDNGVYNDPINSILPIRIAYYENDYSIYVAYDIIAQVRDDKLTVIINDKTGGNRQAALDQLKEKGINPDDYTIVYNDLSAEQTPSRAPDDANI